MAFRLLPLVDSAMLIMAVSQSGLKTAGSGLGFSFNTETK